MAQRKSPTKSQRPTRKSTRAASRKTKSSSKRTKAANATTGRGDDEVQMDRRRAARRANDDQGDAASQSNVLPTRLERRKKVNRRRQIDPTTCERDYTDDEIQFMNALDDYKRKSGRMFPTCSEMLEVVRSLGYVKLSPSELAAHPADKSMAPSAESSAASPDAHAAADQ